MVTFVAPERFVPEIFTLDPGAPLAGENPPNVGSPDPDVHSCTRLLLVSATRMFPDESSVTPSG
jgi:hypothetical protein